MATQPIPAALAAAYEDALTKRDVAELLKTTAELQKRGSFRHCEQWLQQAREAVPDEPRFAVRMLEIYLRYRSWPEFDALEKEAVARHADAWELYYVIGCGHEARGEWAEAANAFERASALNADETESVLREVRALRIQGKARDAIQVLKRALKRHDEVAPLHANMGYALVDERKPEEAVKHFRRALDHQPDWQPYLDDLAGALMLSERWREAAAAAIKSLEQRKANERAWTVYGIAFHKMGDDKRAEQGYKNAIRAAKNPSRAKGNYGLFLSSRPERLLEAARLLKEAYRQHPDWHEVGAALDLLLDSR